MKLYFVVTVLGKVIMTLGPWPSPWPYEDCEMEAKRAKQGLDAHLDDFRKINNTNLIFTKDLKAFCVLLPTRPKLDEEFNQ